MTYKIGDLVKLKSGGPTMTVTHVPDQLRFDGNYTTKWFAGAKLEVGHFPENALVETKEDEKK
jgi:uncharacterized protein YodC (DUF2158 family)